jgi:hypothetical protein
MRALRVGSTGENLFLPVHRWGNNIVHRRDRTLSSTQSGLPHRSDHPCLHAWLNRVVSVGSVKLMSSLKSSPPICHMLHRIGPSSPGASLDRSVVGRWGTLMWTGETLWRGDGLELPSMLDYDWETRMARSRVDTAVVEGAWWLVWGWKTLGGWGVGV